MEAYGHRGSLLGEVCLYCYMTLLVVRRRSAKKGLWGDIPFEADFAYAKERAQVLPRSGMHAVVCLDGFLHLYFNERQKLLASAGKFPNVDVSLPW